VGQRLVEMLVERGAGRVVSFDILPKPPTAWENPKIQYVQGDLRNFDDVLAAVEGAGCVWHIGAAVGPFHPKQLYHDVNVQGTQHVLDACKRWGVPKLVMSSSPSTRFDGSDVDGLLETELPSIPQAKYLQEYAKTKADGELLVTRACEDSLLTVAVAPHQVYGPRDTLFLPNMLETASAGKLRIFGNGLNRVCFTHVDNYAHGLIIAERALYKDSPALGKFYICTDGASHTHPDGYGLFWEELDKAVVGCGFPALASKFHLPLPFMMVIAHICNFIGWMLGTKLKLSPFTVKMLTMHRWFKFELAERDLKYKPIIGFADGWQDTVDWFKTEWLPTHLNNKEASGYGAIHKGSQQKIDGQVKKIN